MIATTTLTSDKQRSTGASIFVVAGVFVAALLFVGCNQKTAVEDFDQAKDASPSSEVKKGIKPQPDDQVAVIASADLATL